MQRVIKFRVWHKQRNSFVKSHGCSPIMDCGQCTAFHIDDFNNSFYIFSQFTGLNDCEETPIYEGDLVQCFQSLQNPNGEIVPVVFKDGMWCLEGHKWGNFIPFPIFLYHNACYPLTLKVVGNIYENKPTENL